MAIGNRQHVTVAQGFTDVEKTAGLYMRMSSCETDLVLAVPFQLHGLDPL